MNKQDLKDILQSQVNRRENYLKKAQVTRTCLFALEQQRHLPQICIVTGVRRCGKSTLMAQLYKRHYENQAYYINFEDERLLAFQVQDFVLLQETLVEMYGSHRVFFLDEIQNIEGWELFVRRLHDEGYKFYITGSNASLLSKELGTRLTGRCVSFELFPLSFLEYLEYVDKKSLMTSEALHDPVGRALLNQALLQYVNMGGFPDFLQQTNPEVLQQIYNDILYRDIVTRFEVKDIRALKELGLYLLSHVSCAYSYNKLKGLLAFGGINTLKNFIDYLENSYLFYAVHRFDASLKQQQWAPKKNYCVDNGLSYHLGFRVGKNIGHLIENLVYLCLRQRKHTIYYYRCKTGQEVDFVLRHGVELTQFIQVSAYADNQETLDRELQALTAALAENSGASGLLLTLEPEKYRGYENERMQVLPLFQWLLGL